VLVRLGEERAVIVDPFNGGAIVPPVRLAALLSRALGDSVRPEPEHVAPMSNRATLVRLLVNQASRAEQAGDSRRALTLYERMTLVAPDNPDAWWQLARLQLHTGSSDTARHSLSAMLEVTRDPERRELVVAALEALATR
jgi:regulator of sirC expression with transglutaminase-like and TPR domain